MVLKGKVVNIECGVFTAPARGELSTVTCGRHEGLDALKLIRKFEKAGEVPDKVTLYIEMSGEHFLEPKTHVIIAEIGRGEEPEVDIRLA